MDQPVVPTQPPHLVVVRTGAQRTAGAGVGGGVHAQRRGAHTFDQTPSPPSRGRRGRQPRRRARRWPNTANPYKFINHRNAGKLLPVGFHWVSRTMDVPVSVIRDDRILHEVNATSGDLRRICELFGIKVEAALRYLPEPNLSADALRVPSCLLPSPSPPRR